MSFFKSISLSLDEVKSENEKEYSYAAPLHVHLASALQICRGTAATLKTRMIHH